MRSASAAFFLHLIAVCSAATVESVHSLSCEWQYGVNSSDMRCAAQRDRVACYPETNCAGGVFYGLFLQDWLARCPRAPVVEYNRMCGEHLRTPPTARSVALVVVVSVLSGGLVIAAGVYLALCSCRSEANDAYAPVRARGCWCWPRPAGAAAPVMCVQTSPLPAFPPLPQPPSNSMWNARGAAPVQYIGTQNSPDGYGMGGTQHGPGGYGMGGTQHGPGGYGMGGTQHGPGGYGMGGTQNSPGGYGMGGSQRGPWNGAYAYGYNGGQVCGDPRVVLAGSRGPSFCTVASARAQPRITSAQQNV
jgi:hypothetical protein